MREIRKTRIRILIQLVNILINLFVMKREKHMKAKSFQQYLEKRLDKSEIAEIEKIAKLEMKFLKSLQEDVSRAVAKYMAEQKIGFNELVRRLNITPTQASSIQ